MQMAIRGVVVSARCALRTARYVQGQDKLPKPVTFL